MMTESLIDVETSRRETLKTYWQCRQWLTFHREFDQTDRMIATLIDCKEFAWKKGVTLKELKEHYADGEGLVDPALWENEFYLEAIDWDRVAEVAYDLSQGPINYAAMV